MTTTNALGFQANTLNPKFRAASTNGTPFIGADDLEQNLNNTNKDILLMSENKIPKKIGCLTSFQLVALIVFLTCVAAAIVGAVVGSLRAAQGIDASLQQNVSFRIIHINDMHARVEGILSSESGATFDDRKAGNRSDGGWPKIFSAAKKFVDSTPHPVIFLEDGDQFMGTIWHSYYKGQEAWEFLNVLCKSRADGGAGFHACIGGIGNHEFDGKYYQLLQYVRNISYPMVSSNILDSCLESEFGEDMQKSELGKRIANYTIITLPDARKTKIGIVGYLTPETLTISSPPPCFNIVDEIDPVKLVVNELKSKGVDIIIGLGHSGYSVDQSVGRLVDNLDVIVGGHSHTFLWNTTLSGPNPKLSDGTGMTFVEGGYPTLVNNPSGKQVPILQAFYGSRFMGVFDVTFDLQGNLIAWDPKITLLGDDESYSRASQKFPDDPVAVGILNRLSPALNSFRNQLVGYSAIDATAKREEVRGAENIVGNMICDAMMYYMETYSNFGQVDLCLMNSGGVRTGIESGPLTLAEVLAILPFNNVMGVLQVTGRQLYLAMENGVSRVGEQKGEFPQIGGFKFSYDSSIPASCSPVGPLCTGAISSVTRVLRIEKDGVLIPNDNSRTFKLVTNDFTARGGDFYNIFNEAVLLYGAGAPLDEAFKTYVASFGLSGITGAIEGRIVNCFTTDSPLCGADKFAIYQKIPVINKNVQALRNTKVFVRGIIVWDSRNTSTGGFYLQANQGQHKAGSNDSEGIFVFTNTTTSLGVSLLIAEGYEIELNATVSTFNDGGVIKPQLTQTSISAVKVLCSDPQVAMPGVPSLKLCDIVNLRKIIFPIAEPISTTFAKGLGMLTEFVGVVGNSFFVADTFTIGTFGELGLSASGTFLPSPTQVAVPGNASRNQEALNKRNYLKLDDSGFFRNTFPTLYPAGGINDTVANTLRAGSRISSSLMKGLTVLDRRFSAWRLQPTRLGKAIIPFNIQQSSDPRTATAPVFPGVVTNNLTLGYIRIASMNVLNYFINFKESCPYPKRDDCRGAANQAQFFVQSRKIYEAIKQMSPAVLALQEMENFDDVTLNHFVVELNAHINSNQVNYTYVATGKIGSDFIKPAIIYDTNLVTPVGTHAVLTYTNPSDKSRPSVAQTFSLKCGGIDKFTIVSNHLKSKSDSGCGSDCDSTDFMEGAFANARAEHARQLKDWIETDPTNSGSSNFLLMGDFNSNRFERTIVKFTNSSYVDLASRDTSLPYSYQFGARFGTLDYGIASSSMATACNKSVEWHINSVEPIVLDFTGIGLPNNPYRASDHDPFIVGCRFTAPPTATC